MCRILKKLYGEENFEWLSYDGTYENIIPIELLDQYQIAERIRCFSRKEILVDPSSIDLLEDYRKKF